MSQQQSWHPVTPNIVDPDLVPPKMLGRYSENNPLSSGFQAGNAPKEKSFFAKHKFAIIISVIVLVVLLVIIYVYLTKRGKKKDGKDGKANKANRPSRQVFPPNFDAAELNRIRAARANTQKGNPQRRRPAPNGRPAYTQTPPPRQTTRHVHFAETTGRPEPQTPQTPNNPKQVTYPQVRSQAATNTTQTAIRPETIANDRTTEVPLTSQNTAVVQKMPAPVGMFEALDDEADSAQNEM